MANVDKLEKAGLVETKKLSGPEKALIETLSESEVDAIISAHRKLGNDAIKGLYVKGMNIL